MIISIPQQLLDELATWMDRHTVQSLTLNRLPDRPELKIECRSFSSVRVTTTVAYK